MNHLLIIFFIILAITSSIGGVEIALKINLYPGPYIPPHHAKWVVTPHTPEVLTLPTMTTPSP